MTVELQLGFLSRSRVRLVRNSERAESGLACLAMLAGYLGLDVSLESLRRRYRPSLRGLTHETLVAIADDIGLTARTVNLPAANFSQLHLPAIIPLQFNDYVVLERVRGRKALIHDPDGHSTWRELDWLKDHFSGTALELRPAEDFDPGQKVERIGLRHLWRRIVGFKRAAVQVLVLSFVLQAFVLVSPYYMQVAIDTALPALDQDLLIVLALGFGIFTLINVGASLLRSFVLLSAGASLSFGITTNIARRLFRLPVTWFERRHVGDILSRFQSVSPIQLALTQGAVGALIDGGLAILTLALMLFYSAKLAMIAVLAFLLYSLVLAVSFSLRRDAQEAHIVAAAKEQSTLIESVRGMTTLRLFNREAARHAKWQTNLSETVNASISMARVNIGQQTANSLIFGLETVFTIWLAISLVISGGFSVGMVFAYLAYKAQFLTRAKSLVDQIVEFRMLGLHLERLSDIALADEDVSFTRGAAVERGLIGRIELRDIRFRYGPRDPLVLDGINLTVEQGEHVAITGPSGGGKSTLVKLMLGLTEPESGEMLVDGMPLSAFGYRNFHRQIAAVLQDDNLFAGTIADNIALFDEFPDMERIRAVSRIAAIEEDIDLMPSGFDTLVGDMGSTLSGGQKQRVLLARALYREPKLLVMDEGTSHLDAQREKAINTAIAELGITRIVIAHREDTIRSARRIYRIDRGRLLDLSPDGSLSAPEDLRAG